MMRIRNLIVEDTPDNTLLDPLKPEQIDVIKKFSYYGDGIIVDSIKKEWFDYAILLVTDYNDEELQEDFRSAIIDLAFLPEDNPMPYIPENSSTIWGYDIEEKADMLIYVKDGKCFKGVEYKWEK